MTEHKTRGQDDRVRRRAGGDDLGGVVLGGRGHPILEIERGKQVGQDEADRQRLDQDHRRGGDQHIGDRHPGLQAWSFESSGKRKTQVRAAIVRGDQDDFVPLERDRASPDIVSWIHRRQ